MLPMSRPRSARSAIAFLATTVVAASIVGSPIDAQKTQKPPLHGRHWVAVTGKPLAATAGAMIFQQGGNAVDAACAMLGAVATMWDVLSWGGETQALIYHPGRKQVIAINALGVAPTGATADFYRSRGMNTPPEFGPLSAVTPGTPGGLMTMLAEFGTLSLAQVLAPAIQMADGYAIDAQTANSIESNKARIKQWKYAREVMLAHPGEAREAPAAGEVFAQRDLAATLRSWSRQSASPYAPARIARPRFTRRTTVSIAGTSPRRSCAVYARRAACSRVRIWPTGR